MSSQTADEPQNISTDVPQRKSQTPHTVQYNTTPNEAHTIRTVQKRKEKSQDKIRNVLKNLEKKLKRGRRDEQCNTTPVKWMSNKLTQSANKTSLQTSHKQPRSIPHTPTSTDSPQTVYRDSVTELHIYPLLQCL